MLRVLLCCGAGASSGFIAQRMRKAAKARNIEIETKAISETEIEYHIDDYDILLCGPHLHYKINEMKASFETENRPVMLIDKKKYSSLDGEGVLNDVLAVKGQ